MVAFYKNRSMPQLKYVTVEKQTQTEIVIEKSRFITLVAPCPTEKSAREILLARKKEHPFATHNCYAFIADNGVTTRFSDDGEPGGTAGAPIMEALKRSGVTNVIVVVTRYFGGIKLGAGGLTRAYARCASEGIKSAEVKTYEMADKLFFSLGYEDYNVFLKMKSADFKTFSVDFSDKVNVTVFVKSEAISRFSELFKETFLGRYSYENIGEEYYCFD